MGTVSMGEAGTGEKEESEGRRLRWWYMVDGLSILMWSRTKNLLAIALSRMGKGFEGERWWGRCK
jgi:hypothetical protein